VRQLGANAHGEVLEAGQVPDCYLGLLLHDDNYAGAAGVLIVSPAALLHPSVPQPDGALLYELVTGHPDRAPRELVFLADLTVELVQAVAQRRVRLGEQVAVAVQHEAGRGVAGPHGDLLRGGAGRDPQRHRRVPQVVDAQAPGRPAARVAGRQMRLRNAVTRSGPPADERNTGSVGRPGARRCSASSSTTRPGSPIRRRLARVLGGPNSSRPSTSTTVSATSTVPASRSTRLRRSPASSPMRSPP
jgi:hypothetical protein